jgi:hypothetical protein
VRVVLRKGRVASDWVILSDVSTLIPIPEVREVTKRGFMSTYVLCLGSQEWPRSPLGKDFQQE